MTREYRLININNLYVSCQLH